MVETFCTLYVCTAVPQCSTTYVLFSSPPSIPGTATSCREREKYHQHVEGPSHQGEHFVTTATVTTILSSCNECDCLLQYQNQLAVGPETVEEVKKGLQFGRLIQLPSNLLLPCTWWISLYQRAVFDPSSTSGT